MFVKMDLKSQDFCSDSIRTEQVEIKCMNSHFVQSKKNAKRNGFPRADFVFSSMPKSVWETPLLSFQFLPR